MRDRHTSTVSEAHCLQGQRRRHQHLPLLPHTDAKHPGRLGRRQIELILQVPQGVLPIPHEPDRLPERSVIGRRKGGGAGGIRTLDTLLTYTHFPGERLRPLGHRSALLWKGVC